MREIDRPDDGMAALWWQSTSYKGQSGPAVAGVVVRSALVSEAIPLPGLLERVEVGVHSSEEFAL